MSFLGDNNWNAYEILGGNIKEEVRLEVFNFKKLFANFQIITTVILFEHGMSICLDFSVVGGDFIKVRF